MFHGFANVWTVIGLARDFATGKLYPRQVAGEKVVLFRDAAGTLSALLDRCPHRGVALSLGKLQDGVVECPFHGWCFNGTGACTRVPWNPDAKRDNLSATALPVRELGGLAWLYTGFNPAEEPQVSPTLLDPRVVLCGQAVRWQVHWTRAMENMLDSPHLPFVHKGSIGRGLASAYERTARARPAGGRRRGLRYTGARAPVPVRAEERVSTVTAARPAMTRLAEARRSVAMTVAPESCSTPSITATLPSIWIFAPRRTSSLTCM